MVVFINGSFGIGKTTVARLLAARRNGCCEGPPSTTTPTPGRSLQNTSRRRIIRRWQWQTKCWSALNEVRTS
jgi:hypothetical protein